LKAKDLKQFFGLSFLFGFGLMGFLFGGFFIETVSWQFRRFGHHIIAPFIHLFFRTAASKTMQEQSKQHIQEYLPYRNHGLVCLMFCKITDCSDSNFLRLYETATNKIHKRKSGTVRDQ
jgi:hypothetical protein